LIRMKKYLGSIIFLTISIVLLTRVLVTTPVYFSSFAKTIIPSALIPKLVPVSIPGDDRERVHVQKELEDEIAAEGVQDNVSVYYKNISSAYEVRINADRSWIPASTVKAFALLEAFRQKRERIINFDSRVTIDQQNVVPTELESQDYQALRAGSRATIRELVYAMITQSDNTAFNTLLDILDRRNITATLRKLGLEHTVVGEKLSLNDAQYAIDLHVPGRQPNRTTARDFGHIFEILSTKQVQDADEMLTILKQQKLNDMIPALLPPDVPIAHKTGTWSPYYHDGGIVYKPNDPYIIAIFTNTDNANVIAKLSKIAYDKNRNVLGISATNIVNTILEIFYRGERFFIFGL